MWFPATALLFVAFQNSSSMAGLKALDAKNYQEAVQDFTASLAQDPKDYATHFNLAFALSMLGKNAEATAEYRKTLEIKPDLYQAQLNLGILLVRQKQPADAVPLLEKAVAQKPTEFRPNFHLGAAYLATKQFPQAADSFTKAAGIDVKSAAAELGLAQAYAGENRLSDAAPHFEKAAALDPKFRDGLLQLAVLYENAKQPQQAIALYRQFPDDPGAREHLATLLLAAGHADEAVTQLEGVYATSPTQANRFALITAYVHNKQEDKALPLIQQALAATPNDYDVRILYADILRDDRKFRPSAGQFLAAAKIKPDSVDAWTGVADMLVLAEDYQPALEALDHVRALHAEKPGHLFLRAIVLDKLKQTKPALEAYRQFLDASNGKFPDQDFQARQRARILQHELDRK